MRSFLLGSKKSRSSSGMTGTRWFPMPAEGMQGLQPQVDWSPNDTLPRLFRSTLERMSRTKKKDWEQVWNVHRAAEDLRRRT